MLNNTSGKKCPQKTVCLRSVSVGALLAFGLMSSAAAQEADTSAETEDDTYRIDTVTVTAQKREQSLQDVPSSIAVVGGEQLREQGLRRMDELAEFVPNLTQLDVLTSPITLIRGQGTGNGNFAFEQSVATFLDGTYLGRNRVQNLAFLDLAQVEVLRGPQPTYFGTNATAGALNLTSRNPSMDAWEGNVNAAYGEDNEYSIDGGFGGPIAEGFAVRLAANYNHIDGWLKGANTGQDSPERDSYALRGTALWEASERLTANFKVSYANSEQSGGLNLQLTGCPEDIRTVNFFGNPVPAYLPCQLQVLDPNLNGDFAIDDIYEEEGAFGVIPDGTVLISPLGDPVRAFNTSDIQDTFNGDARDVEATLASLQLDYDLGGGYTLTSITSYTDFESEFDFVIDFTAYGVFASGADQTQEEWAQELRLASPVGQDLEWLVGANFRSNEFTNENSFRTAYQPGSNTCVAEYGAPGSPGFDPRVFRCFGALTGAATSNHEESTDWLSFYGSANYRVTENLTLDFGVRYEDVTKDGFFFTVPLAFDPDVGVDPNFTFVPCGPVPGEGNCTLGPQGNNNFFDDSIDESKTNFSVGARYRVNDDVLLYGKWGQGFKAGGFQVITGADFGLDPETFTFDSETAEGFELGAKTTWLGGRLVFNAAYFNTEFEDLQVSALDRVSGAFLTTNAGASTSEGIEIDGVWVANEYLNINFSAALLDATYDDFTNGICAFGETPTGDSGTPFDPSDDVCDRTGRTLPFSSEWTISLNPTLTLPVANDYEFTFSPQLLFADGFNAATEYAINPALQNDDYEIIDLRAGFGPVEGNWEVALYGRNVTDTRNFIAVNDSFANPGAFQFTQSRGARYGVQLNLNF